MKLKNIIELHILYLIQHLRNVKVINRKIISQRERESFVSSR